MSNMVHGKDELYAELRESINNIDKQLEVLKAQAKRSDCTIFEMRLADGSWPASQLFTARAMAVAAIVTLGAY